MQRLEPRELGKILLSRLGARCGERTVYNLNGAFNYLHVGWWLRAHGFDTSLRLPTRWAIFDRIAADVGERRTLYLEFGVHQGVSLSYWCKLLRHPEARLHGFDSFLGLPHDWSLEGHPRGDFSTGGVPPEIDDARVEFFVGWFDETLPAYEWPESDALVVMLDADLYSSTAAVLAFVRDRLVPGSYLYFDQLHHRCDELRAFAEFLDENELTFELVGACPDLSSVAFRRVA
jgi:hypothetical protein